MNKFLPIVFMLCAMLAAAQTKSIKSSPPLTDASPSSVGMSDERLLRIDAMIKESINKGDIPGAVALVARNGKIVYHKAFGVADQQTGRAFKTDDIFRIASQSKAITSTAVMMLWEEGKFRLDDPISKYIPEFSKATVLDSLHADGSYTTKPVTKPITIRHLLTHTSGIGYGVIDGDERFKKIYNKAGIVDLFTTENVAIGDNVKKLATLPLHHNPGEKWTYSEGLDVLGYFIEVMSGMPFDQFLRKRLFDPLGMKDTWFYQPKENNSRLVPVQEKKNGKWVRYPTTFYDPDYPIKGAQKFFSGGAGLSGTIKDYGNFLQMYLNGGELNGIRILSRTTIRFMMANQIGDLWGAAPENHIGLGFSVVTQHGQDVGGNGSIGTFSWGGYFNTSYKADPEEQWIALIYKQLQGEYSDSTGWKFIQLVGQAVDD